MGYKPDWQNQSMAKAGAPTVKHGIQSRELFHGAKKGLPGFADGEVVDIANLPELREPTAADRGEAPAAAPTKFGDAFKSARASGAKEFEWQGKKYTTQLKEEVKASPKPAEKKSGFDIEDGKFMEPKAKTFAEDVAERKKAKLDMAPIMEAGKKADAPAKKMVRAGRGSYLK